MNSIRLFARYIKTMIVKVLQMMTAMEFATCALGNVGRSLFIGENKLLVDKKIVCWGTQESVFTVVSQLQCMHRCLGRDNCRILNYRELNGEKSSLPNCELYEIHENWDGCQSIKKTGWIALIPKVQLKV